MSSNNTHFNHSRGGGRGDRGGRGGRGRGGDGQGRDGQFRGGQQGYGRNWNGGGYGGGQYGGSGQQGSGHGGGYQQNTPLGRGNGQNGGQGPGSGQNTFTPTGPRNPRPPHPPGQPQPAQAQQTHEIFPFARTYADTDSTAALANVNQYARDVAIRDKKDPGDRDIIEGIKYNHGLRDAFQNRGSASVVATNYLTMIPPPQVYVYGIKMLRSATVEVRKRADRQLIFDLHLSQTNDLRVPQGQPKTWVTDYSLIWSTTPLFKKTTNVGEKVREIGRGGYRNECGEQLQFENVVVSYEDTIQCNIQLFNDPAAGTDKDSRPGVLLRGLNAFLCEEAKSTQNVLFSTGGKAFDTQTPRALQSKGNNPILVALKGFSLSTRPGISNFLVNINTATSAFLARQRVEDIITSSVCFGMNPKQKLGVLKGLKVKIAYNVARPNWTGRPDGSQFRFIRDISNLDASQQATTANPNQTVAAWFRNNANRNHHLFPVGNINIPPRTHAIKVATSSGETRGGEEWYPANLLEIVENQRFNNALSSIATTNMISTARLTPNESVYNIITPNPTVPRVGGLQMFALYNQSGPTGLTTRFGGMSTGTNLLEIPEYRLQAPQVSYGDTNLPSPRNATWNLSEVKFKSPARIEQLPYFNLTSTRSDHKLLSGNLRTLESALTIHGIAADPSPRFTEGQVTGTARNTEPSPQYETAVSDMLKQLSEAERRSVVLVLIPAKNYDQYAYIKRVAELQLGIHTVFCVQDANRLQRFNPQSASNVALKFNLRSQGINHSLGNQGFAALKTQARSEDTIVIGADVTHPPTSASPGTPSIAAVVGNTDPMFMHFPGSMRLQRARQEEIAELGDMVKERLIDWAEKHGGRLPRNMLFYRDGVSESQYDRLRDYEIPQIQSAYNWAREYIDWSKRNPSAGAVLDQQRHPWPRPAPPTKDDNSISFDDTTGLSEPFNLTYVVVGKRHNTRFYAIDRKDRADNRFNTTCDNVRPGLVVDQVITHPHSLDFYLQSHKPIAGTGRSAHYFTLQNDMQFSADELQRVTHDFCYAYARATKGVSYCAPAYYADRLCDRGRAYLRHWLTRQDHQLYRASRAIRNRNLPTNVAAETFTAYNEFVKNELRDSSYYRPVANQGMMKYGFARRNPWHPNMDGAMFYL